MVAVFIAGGVALLALFVYLAYQQAKKRREAFAAFAAAHGLTYTAKDPYRLERSYDFQLFGLGAGRGCENVMAGQWEGLPVRSADYWYYTESRDSEGRTSRTYHRFSVLIVELQASLPNVRVERENVFTRLADHMGFHDIEFESEDFNRRFNVKSRDREFAYKLIDARMMHWLLGAEHKVCLEANGPHVLLYCNQLKPERLVELFQTGKAFVDHVPRLVWNEYGKAAS